MLSSTPRGPWLGENPKPNNHVIHNNKEALLFNKEKRGIRCPAALGARLRAGSGKPAYLMGIGDCILLDFSKGFFAISDSPERNSTASRRFLLRFAHVLQETVVENSQYIYTKEELDALRDALIKKSEQLLRLIVFNDSCTFTGLFIANTNSGKQGILIHSGDSFLIHCDMKMENAQQLTKTNFWMVGKSNQFSQIEYVKITSETRFFLTTDGILHLNLPENPTRELFVLDLFHRYAVDELPDKLLEDYDSHHKGRDDIGIIALDPNTLPFMNKRIIMGGTTNRDEMGFQEMKEKGIYQNQYLPVSQEDKTIIF